ncbi:MAG: aminopeptidase [Spirochaetes bacterium]|nr:aminopeptidase [Spirochaetota bacterium]
MTRSLMAERSRLALRSCTLARTRIVAHFRTAAKCSARLLMPLALVFLLTSCWYTKQAGYFLGERFSARNLAKLAEADDAAPELGRFYRLVSDLRRYAVEQGGLSPTKNYTRYVLLDRDYVASVVSACAADSFERYYWKYPFLGSMPYKGFYVEADARKEVARLKEAGLDVVMRRVDAFSSLGFFRDPLYSFMLDYDEAELAELIFHESAHATLFIKNADQFNEEFATFIGRLLTETYLTETYGPANYIQNSRQARQQDRQAFTDFLKESARQLELVYTNPQLNKEQRLAAKVGILQARADEYQLLSQNWNEPDYWANFDMASINNAYLDLYRLYEEDLSLYERWFAERAQGDIQRFISTLIQLADSTGTAIKEERARLLSQAANPAQ